jgi:hypothetical protein
VLLRYHISNPHSISYFLATIVLKWSDLLLHHLITAHPRHLVLLILFNQAFIIIAAALGEHHCIIAEASTVLIALHLLNNLLANRHPWDHAPWSLGGIALVVNPIYGGSVIKVWILRALREGSAWFAQVSRDVV